MSRCAPVIAVVASALAAGCSSAANEDPGGAADLWQRVHAASYRAWARAPGHETRTAGTGPHASSIDVYVDSTLAAALSGPARTEWPVGSIIVKDGFDGDAQKLVAVMEKRDDGWFYAEYDPTGVPNASGHPHVCTSCHQSGDDFVRSFSLPR